MKTIPAILLIAAAFSAVPLCAAAQSFPTRPVRLVVPYAAGGGSDLYARLIAAKLSETWGQQVVVDNRGGGGTVIGTTVVARSAPDGYTMLLAANPYTTNAAVNENLPYDTLRDVAPLTMIASAPIILVVHPSLPVRSVSELIAYSKKNPDKVNYGTSGNGGPQHIAGELFKSMTGTEIVHIPYKGSGPATTDLLGGQIQLGFSSIAIVQPFVKAGRLRPLAVTGLQRSPLMPDVPTVHESGVPNFSAITWYGMFTRGGTPAPIVKTLNTEIVRTLKTPDVRDRITGDAAEVVANDPEAFTAFLRAEIERVRKLVKATGIKLN